VTPFHRIESTGGEPSDPVSQCSIRRSSAQNEHLSFPCVLLRLNRVWRWPKRTLGDALSASNSHKTKLTRGLAKVQPRSISAMCNTSTARATCWYILPLIAEACCWPHKLLHHQQESDPSRRGQPRYTHDAEIDRL